MAQTIKAKKREEIDNKYKWDLSYMYADDKAWEGDYAKAKGLMKELEGLKGSFDSSEKLLKCLVTSTELSRLVEKLYTYSRMRKDEDNRNTTYIAMFDKAQSIATEAAGYQSFIVPEILSLSNADIEKYMSEKEELKLYKHYLEEIMRQKEHILSSREEEILAATGDMAGAPQNIFSMFNNADIKFPVIKNENGDEVEITHGNFITLMESRDREVRKNAFEGLYSVYEKNANMLTATMNANVKKDIFYSKMRKYNSCLEAALDDDNISTDVYNKLIESVHNNLGTLHRYMKLKKKLLKVEELHMYDMYVPLISEFDMKVEYEEAKGMVKEGLKPLGEEYLGLLDKAYAEGWIDVYENEGKTSGAYSWGTYDSKPYVLLNYHNNVDNVFTLAHELGHSMHSHYSSSNQPYLYAEYPIFLAEVASTTNENLLIKYMLKKSTDKNEKLYLLNHYLEEFRGTVFRQTMFAEFEKWTHEEVEKGEALTTESLKKKYYELNKQYFGEEMVVDQEIDMEWSRIPHFYTPFYVYKYATGFSAAAALAKAILEEGDSAVVRYKEFLKSGGSDYPLNILKKAGVDMATPEPVDDALKVFEELLTEMEKLVG